MMKWIPFEAMLIKKHLKALSLKEYQIQLVFPAMVHKPTPIYTHPSSK
jgi:hypothetical protein